jgi:hypothetical protein
VPSGTLNPTSPCIDAQTEAQSRGLDGPGLHTPEQAIACTSHLFTSFGFSICEMGKQSHCSKSSLVTITPGYFEPFPPLLTASVAKIFRFYDKTLQTLVLLAWRPVLCPEDREASAPTPSSSAFLNILHFFSQVPDLCPPSGALPCPVLMGTQAISRAPASFLGGASSREK